MDITLALDTVGSGLGLALAGHDGTVTASQRQAMARGHAEALLPAIDKLLLEPGLDYGAIDRIAVTTGPGAFTGVRVGLAVARGLGLALDRPVFGVSALRTACLGAAADHSLLVTLAGRGDSLFWEVFAPVAKDAGDNPAAALMRPTLYGPGNDERSAILTRYSAATDDAVPRQHIADPAIDPGLIALAAQALDNPEDWPPEPHYLRAPDAAPSSPLFSVRAS